MDSDAIHDLKQFISAEMRLHTSKFEKRLDELEALINGTMNVYLTAVQENFDDHEHRIKKLETRHAS